VPLILLTLKGFVRGTRTWSHSQGRNVTNVPERNHNADVLVLGDSFCNIYSLEQMGWGESAGFVEQLSRALGGRPIDCILRNSDGAFATREILGQELARGNDRLLGKKIIIWEFAARELAFGNWKSIDMELGKPAPSHFLTLKSEQDLIVTGVVQAMG
jgi:hypothetical protein